MLLLSLPPKKDADQGFVVLTALRQRIHSPNRLKLAAANPAAVAQQVFFRKSLRENAMIVLPLVFDLELR
jgi:hypothetical protein